MAVELSSLLIIIFFYFIFFFFRVDFLVLVKGNGWAFGDEVGGAEDAQDTQSLSLSL